jgi:hypothetical protein
LFSDATTLDFYCSNGGDESDIIVNSISAVSQTELIANISVKGTTTCFSDQVNFNRLNSLIIDESYSADNQLDVKNTTIEVGPDNPISITSIMNGLDDALSGDTVLVDDGEYVETIDMNKSGVKLISKNGTSTTFITNPYCDNDVVIFTNDNTSIEDFTIRPNTTADCINYGINTNGTNGNTIKGMYVSDNFDKALRLSGTSQTITGNELTNNNIGLEIDSLTGSIISGNRIHGNAAGATNSATDFGGVVDVGANWWGDASGPLSYSFNARGLGNELTGPITFSDWCSDPSCAILIDQKSAAFTSLSGLFTTDNYLNNWLLRAPSGIEASSTQSLTANFGLTITVPTTGSSTAIIIPAGTTITRIDNELFSGLDLVNSPIDIGNLSGTDNLTPVGNSLQCGLPSFGLTFSQPIDINLFVGPAYDGKTLAIFRSHSTSSDWTTEGLINQTCAVVNGYCRFKTDKASYFTATTNQLPSDNKPVKRDGGSVIITPGQSPIFEESHHATTSIEHRDQEKPATSTPVDHKPPKPNKQVLGEKKYVDGSLLRDITTKKIYLLSGDNKHVIRTLTELQWKHKGKTIFNLIPSDLSRWKDI